jgi:hypothetical protein
MTLLTIGCVVQGVTTLPLRRAFNPYHGPIVTHIQVIAPQHGRDTPGPFGLRECETM